MPENDIDAVYANRAFGEVAFAWFSVVGSAAGFLGAITIALLEGNLAPAYLALFMTFLVSTGVGVSLGLHRLFSHASFTAARPLEICLALLGAASGQGYFFRWINDHNLHHRYTDKPGDPHSPYFYGEQKLPRLRGFLHAHFLWLLRDRSAFASRHLGKLRDDPVMVQIDRLSPHITLLGTVIPGIIAYLLIEPTGTGFIKGMLWGGLARICVMNQITWSVNSFGHMYGSQPQAMKNEARNNTILGWLAFGDGWHANHHLVAAAAIHGWEPHQFDFNGLLIRMAEKMGWATNANRQSKSVTNG